MAFLVLFMSEFNDLLRDLHLFFGFGFTAITPFIQVLVFTKSFIIEVDVILAAANISYLVSRQRATQPIAWYIDLTFNIEEHTKLNPQAHYESGDISYISHKHLLEVELFFIRWHDR